MNRTEKLRRSEGTSGLKWLGAFLVAITVSFCFSAPASAQTRSLKLYFIHTKERAEITYMRNGRFDKRGLDEINRFLRDWRRNEPAKMDPKVVDLLWQVYNSVGARDYIHVVSAYRSPATNKMLRSRSSGVAENSQHTLGKAIDFYIPGVPLSKLRAAGFKAEGGGVGYYPKSGSPFVHLDVGNVRSWPRMSRRELSSLFPDGKTIHLPADGKPLPGYQQAMAAYKSRQRSGAASIQIASASSDSGSGGGLLSALFGSRNSNDEPAPQPTRAAAAPAASAPQPVAPVRETPETIIAALPERSIPLPGVAPRPMVHVGAPAAAPLIAGLPEQEAPAPAPEMTPVEIALEVPLPTRRPDYSPEPATEPAVAVASATASPAVNDIPLSAIAGARRPDSGSDAISDMLATTAAEARADVVINPPVPSLRPKLAGAADMPQLAALRSEESNAGEIFVLASLPKTGATQNDEQLAEAVARRDLTDSVAAKQQTVAALSATPRTAVLKRAAGSDPASALESGVRTTAKSSKPQAGMARAEPKPVAIPIERGLTRWAFVRDVTVATAGGSKEREKAYDTVWSAPQTVYTEGFKQGSQATDAHRFTGKAVTFMSVARFGTN
ncbi:DUF882 domain-containing protein [Mesorhizobium sp. CAU 1741]|uniref:DUF882 domain-containing protein n=1 Tax=Mesorhizobium sp. CAU 1741 TaxID=3140366 RepID=UPI00325C0920